MRHRLTILLIVVVAFASCGVVKKQPARNVYWEIVGSHVILDNGEEVADMPVGVAVTVCVEYEKRTGPLDGPGVPYVGRQRTKGQVFNMILAANDGEKFRGGLDTLRANVTLDRKGRGYIRDVLVESAPWVKAHDPNSETQD